MAELASDESAAAEKTARAGSTKVALTRLEKSAYAAWKSKGAKFWDTFLSVKFVGWGSRSHACGRTERIGSLESTRWQKLAELTAENISFINIFGNYLATKADALKDWTSAGCDVKSVSVTQAARTMLSPTSGILTFMATADGISTGKRSILLSGAPRSTLRMAMRGSGPLA